MNIGILCWPTSGGSGVLASELGSALAGRGHEVHIFSYRLPFRMRPRPERLHYHEISMPAYPLFEYPSYGMAAACALAAAIREHHLDIIHAHYAYPHSVSAYLARQMVESRGVRIVTTLHGTDVTLVSQDAAFASITQFGIRQSDAVTAVSEALRQRTMDWLDVTKEICVIPNFVDTDHFRPIHRPRGVPLIVHVSNFRPIKRSADAVRAFYLLRKRRQARLLLVGDGPEVGAIRSLAKKLNVLDDVEFLGEDREIHRVLARAGVLISTSEFEGFGLAALEAMACGVPVVATRAGASGEVVVDGACGFLTAVGAVEEMAERMHEILDDRELARRMGQAGRCRAQEKFSPAIIVPRYEQVYEGLLDLRSEAAHA